MNEPIGVRAPQGLGAEAYASEVLVSVGQTVACDAVLVSIESSKVAVDIQAPSAGRVKQVLVAKNDSVSEGDLLVVLEAIESEQPQDAPSRPQVATAAVQTGAAADTSSDFHASPWIRGLARERGIDLRQVSGTGPHGRILEEDLDRHVPRSVEPPLAAGAAVPGTIAPLEADATQSRRLSRLQLSVGRNLSENWTQIPHVTQFDEADITDVEAFRLAINLERQKDAPKLSLLPFVIKAAACALAAFPEFNSRLLGDQLILEQNVHVGFAVDTAEGLWVPAIRHADRLSVLQIARELARLAELARASKLAATDVQGGTFTISNLGAAGGTAFTPIVNAPQVAILGISKADLEPKWDGSSFVPRLMLPLSLSYDHRVINGVAGARFVSHLGSVLSDLRRALL